MEILKFTGISALCSKPTGVLWSCSSAVKNEKHNAVTTLRRLVLYLAVFMFVKVAETCDWVPRCNTVPNMSGGGPCGLATAADFVLHSVPLAGASVQR